MTNGLRDQGFEGGFVYVAMSDRLTEWALANDRLHLFKIGYSAGWSDRLAYLNGVAPWPKRVRPCLNCTDWRFVGQWSFPALGTTKSTEKWLKKIFDRVFESFDRDELVKDFPAGNGETEIYRLRLRTLPRLPELFQTHGIKGPIADKALRVIETAVVEISRQRSERWAALLAEQPGGYGDTWEDDWPEEDFERDCDDDYRRLVEQLDEDLEAIARADEEGWPY
ncbi:hypothetical protein [Sphingosinicella microcystinivorans]|uniref:hypothetical protein n=1 Tax=Sphingosinicella microcystinivorans TaxID=335406 RepID=UPI0022F380E4|nr:hypothetical protein [Sphingosinicella microcystinivorans]WBX82380.1 hypothetical protein PE061_11090 [Sphingosinicella microcystinivorans]